MATRGVTKEMIVSEAIACIEDSGQPAVSLHELARRLGIKTPSLYNHIRNTRELQHEMMRRAIDQFVANQRQATQGKETDEAVRAFAHAYYVFAAQHRGLYRLIMSMPSENDQQAKELALPLLETVVEIFRGYGLGENGIAHWQRVFRAILHGFISQEDLGYFYYYDEADLNQSRTMAVDCFLVGLHAAMQEEEQP